MIKVQVNPEHIHRDPDQPNPIRLAMQDAGYDNDRIKLEMYSNILPPNHDWGLWIDGQRYGMSHELRRWLSYWYIEHGDRTKPAELLIDDETMTADIRIKRYVSYARQLGYRKINLGGHWE